jgi:hypothetical protein
MTTTTWRMNPDHTIDQRHPLHSGLTVRDMNPEGTILLIDALDQDLPIYDSWLVPDTHATHVYASLIDALAAVDARWGATHEIDYRIEGQHLIATGRPISFDAPWAHEIVISIESAI